MNRTLINLWLLSMISGLLFSPAALKTARAENKQPPVVQVVMFWSETCGYCHYVLNEVLPPLQAKYGEQLDIHLFELQSVQDYDRLYQIADAMRIDKSAVGVPFMIIGEQALIGSVEIPDALPGLVDQYLAQGGVGISGWLSEMLPQDAAETITIYFFWGDGCPHCAEAKPALHALDERYSDVELKEFEVWHDPENQVIFTKFGSAMGFDPRYVPTIIIGDQYWEGYTESYLGEFEAALLTCRQAGCPDMGASIGLFEAASEQDTAGNAVDIPAGVTQVQTDGFGLAIAVLIGMVGALGYSAWYLRHELQQIQRRPHKWRRKPKTPVLSLPDTWRNLGFVILCLIGLGVAGYLAYVETQAVTAVCGPVGDCNTVQSSPYARLFGVLPIGVLGLVGYLVILVTWYLPAIWRHRALVFIPLVVWGLTSFGVLFSLYLTYLEPFVIKAVCMWCLSSAVIMTLLMLLSLKPAMQALRILQETRQSHANLGIEKTSS